MQKKNDVIESNRRMLHRLQKSFRLNFDESKIETNVTINNIKIVIKLLRNDNWQIIITNEIYIIKRIVRIAAVNEILTSKKIYNEKTELFFVQLIFKLFLKNSFVIDLRTKLIIFDSINDNAWIDENEMLRHNDKLYIFENFRIDIMKQYHDNSLTKHFETRNFFKLIQRKYYWFNRDQDFDISMSMREFVQNYCESCATCKRSKTLRHMFYETLTSLSISKFK